MRSMQHRILAVAWASALLALPIHATFASSPAAVAGPTVEGISQYTLSNGLTVLLFPDASKSTVTVNVTYRVGSLQENYGETGMAHLLEHLLFKGTATNTDIAGEMKKRGMKYNASTALDRTNYFETFPADDAQLAWALQLEADRMVNSFIAKKDLDSEMTVVRNEMEAGENNPGNVLIQRMLSTSFLWHNYGNSTIGSRSDVENVSIDRLQAFYKTWYQPDNAVLLVAGRFDPAKTLKLIEASFGRIKRPERELPRLHTVEPVQDGEREVTVRRVGDVKLSALAYHIPPGAHPDTAALSVLARVLGDTPSGRLHKTLVEGKQAAATGAVNFEQHDPGAMLLFAQLPLAGDADSVSKTMIGQVEGLGGKPVTAEEVERAKAGLLKEIELALNDPNGVGLALSEPIAAGDWRMFFLGRDQIEQVTAEQVNRVAGLYLKPSNRTLGQFLPDAKPDRAEIPAAPDVTALLQNYKGRAAVAAGEVFDASPASIEARTQRGTLSSGAKFAFLPKDTRGDTVQGVIRLHYGDEAALKNQGMVANLTGAMLMRGAGGMSRQQLADRLDQLKAQVSVQGQPTGAEVKVLTTREHLPQVMKLVADVLRRPSFETPEYEQLQSQFVTWLEAQRSDPAALAGQAMARHFDHTPVGHPKHVQTFEEAIGDVKRAGLAQAREFHRAFYGADHAEFAFVGDFDAAELKTVLSDLFGDWKSASAYARIPDRYEATVVANQSTETPDKPNAMLLVQTQFPLSEDQPDFPAMVVGNYILGGGTLKSRIGDRLRQKEGLTYGAGSRFNAGVLDQKATLTGFAIAAPQNIPAVEQAIREEIARLIQQGVTEEEVRDAVSGLLKQAETSRNEDAAVANELGWQLFFGRSMQQTIEFERALKGLTAESVNAVLGRYLKPDTISVFKAGNFAGAAKAGAAGAVAR